MLSKCLNWVDNNWLELFDMCTCYSWLSLPFSSLRSVFVGFSPQTSWNEAKNWLSTWAFCFSMIGFCSLLLRVCVGYPAIGNRTYWSIEDCKAALFYNAHFSERARHVGLSAKRADSGAMWLLARFKVWCQHNWKPQILTNFLCETVLSLGRSFRKISLGIGFLLGVRSFSYVWAWKLAKDRKKN